MLTDELQAEKRRENEESLQRFQDEVRHRVAQKAHLFKKRQQLQTDPVVKKKKLDSNEVLIMFLSPQIPT